MHAYAPQHGVELSQAPAGGKQQEQEALQLVPAGQLLTHVVPGGWGSPYEQLQFPPVGTHFLVPGSHTLGEQQLVTEQSSLGSGMQQPHVALPLHTAPVVAHTPLQ